MKKTSRPRLLLSRETVRTLGPGAARSVRGGNPVLVSISLSAASVAVSIKVTNDISEFDCVNLTDAISDAVSDAGQPK